MSLECVDDVEGCDGLALSVFGVGDCVTDDAFEEGLEDAAGFFVDHWRGDALVCCCWQVVGMGKQKGHTGRDTLDTATTRKTTDSGLGYALDVVTKNLSVTLGSAFAETLSTFSAWRDASVWMF